MKIKLLLVVNVDWFFISHRLPIAIAAIKKGYDVHLITSITSHYNLLIRSGLHVHPIHMSRNNMSFFSNIIIFFKLFFTIKKIKPDIVHLITIKPIVIGGLVIRLLNIKSVVISITGLGYIFLEKKFFSNIKKFFLGKLYKIVTNHKNLFVIVQNLDDLKFIKAINKSLKKKVILIKGSGVDLKIFKKRKIPNGAPIIMMASRFLIDKGVFEFYEASKKLHHLGRFVLVGEPDKYNSSSISTGLLDSWVKSNFVENWGPQKNMHNILSKATIVVLPSYREGLPKVLIEAAACGRAIITTNVPGCKESILNGKTGLLVKVKDSESLASKIQYLLTNKKVCLRMGLAGRAFAEKSFNIQTVVNTHLHAYKNLIRNSKKK